MPGRQSTGPPSSAKIKSKKRNAKRSLNALAIAEQEHPVKAQIRKSRLGLAEQDDTVRKRSRDEEESAEDGDTRSSKRRRPGDKDRYGNEIEGGSDSEGNEWVLGQVGSEDDSDLDSDVAMGESDEEKFEGFAFRGSSSTNPKPRARREVSEQEAAQRQEIDLNEDEASKHNSDEESDGLGDDAVDLADALDDNEGESIGSGSESESNTGDFGISDTSDPEDAANSKKLAFLGDMISNMNSSGHPSTHDRPMDRSLESTIPSEFGLKSSQKLTLADLQASITDPNLRKSLKILASDSSKPSNKRNGIPKKLEVPLAKRQQDRLDRAAAYEKSKQTLNRWIDTVKHNRRAEHLSFPLNDPNSAVALASHRMLPTTHSKPVTELEGVIQNILQASGLSPTNSKDGEDQADGFANLPANDTSLEEVQARRAELRRARDLLFREEKRAKRIKKIKSKSYRKVHRKERERNAQKEKDVMAAAGVDDSEEEQERNDRRRAEERMGQRHRESRWAKSVKDSGRAAWDEDARSGVTEMARRGEELRRRIEGRNVEKENDDDASSESGFSGEDDEEDGQKSSNELLEGLGHTEGVSNNGVKSMLSSMPFMQKVNSLRRAQNDAEAKSIRREINGEDSPSEEEASEATGRRSYGSSSNKPPKSISQSEQRSEFEERPPSNEDSENEIRFPEPDEDDLEIVVDVATNSRKSKTKEKQSISRTRISKPSLGNSDPPSRYTDNPWLSTTTKSNRKPKRDNPSADAIISATLPFSPPKPRSSLKGSRVAAAAASRASSTKEPVMLNDIIPDAASEDEAIADSALPSSLQRNRELIARAFAGDAVVADFSAEKDSTAASEAPQTVDTTLPGWGSWVGEGTTKKQRKQNANRFFTTSQGVEKEKRKDAKLEKVIINEKRVKKNGKYLASSLPHPFETKSQYERSLRLPVGPEWTTKETFQGMTKPRVMVKQGVIEAMRRPIV